MGETINELRHEHGASEETLKGVFPPSWVAWAIEQPGENGMRQPTVVAELAAHDGESTTTRKAQHKLGKAVSKIKLDTFMEPLGNLPEEGYPPTQDDPYGGRETTKDMALAKVRSSQGPAALAFFRAAPTDRA